MLGAAMIQCSTAPAATATTTTTAATTNTNSGAFMTSTTSAANSNFHTSGRKSILIRKNENRIKKTVRFASEEELIDLVPKVTELSTKERKIQWFDHGDFVNFKTESKNIGRDCRYMGYGDFLSDAFGGDQQINQHAFNTWASHGHSRRGLERCANSQHDQQRKEYQEVVIRSVLEAQQHQQDHQQEENQEQQQQAQQNRSLNNRADVAANYLAKVSRHHSKRAEIFALRMGHADAVAVSEMSKLRRRASDPFLTRRKSLTMVRPSSSAGGESPVFYESPRMVAQQGTGNHHVAFLQRLSSRRLLTRKEQECNDGR